MIYSELFDNCEKFIKPITGKDFPRNFETPPERSVHTEPACKWTWQKCSPFSSCSWMGKQ